MTKVPNAINGLNAWRRATISVFVMCMAGLATMGVMLMSSATVSTPVNAAPVKAPHVGLIGWLDVAPQADPGGKGMHLTISGRAFALVAVNGRYTIDVRRRGKGGVSNSRQSGGFTIAPGETAAFSRTTINAQKSDRLEIELKLFVGDAEVFAVTMRPSTTTEDENDKDASDKRTL